jgi:hypothetical protein
MQELKRMRAGRLGRDFDDAQLQFDGCPEWMENQREVS